MAGEPPDFIRMDYDRSIDWNMEEQSSGDSVSSEKMRSAVKKGCNVGKKLLVTGLAISSAPVVLPPLVIVSVFGFAASIPYGVFLASYACTEKIMSVWLPIPSPPQFDRADEMVEENGYQEDIDECVEEEDQTLSKEIRAEEEEEDEPAMKKAKSNELLDDLVIDAVVVQGDEENEFETESGEAAAIEVTSVVYEENGGEGRVDYIGDQEEGLKETRGLLERIKVEGRADDVAEANGAVYTVRELEIETEAAEPSDSVEASGFGLSEEANSDALHPHEEYEISEVSSSKPAKFEEDELPSVTIIDVVEFGDDVSVLTIESKVEANAPHKDYKLPSNKESYSEVKIREQIDSMKKIVGYKATALGTYIDEVDALYAFVGVEPPSSLGDSSNDLNQLNDKLQFLMSIVGVK